MKSKFQAGTIMLLLAGISIFFMSCAATQRVVMPTGIDRAEKATAAMQKVDAGMQEASMQIDAVKTSLDDLVSRGQDPSAQASDVKARYTTYVDNVDQMQDISNKLNKDIDAMSESGNAYFQESAKEAGAYTDPEIQRRSAERRTLLSSTFRDMQSSTGNVRANLNAYISDLRQIQQYLSNDLTPQGIATISPIALNVEQEGNTLKQSFDPVQNSILQARDLLTPGGAAAGGAAETPAR